MKTIILMALLTFNGDMVEKRMIQPFDDRASCMSYIEVNGESIVRGIVDLYEGKLDFIGLVCTESWKTQ
jgi:hypothetical protein